MNAENKSISKWIKHTMMEQGQKFQYVFFFSFYILLTNLEKNHQCQWGFFFDYMWEMDKIKNTSTQ